MPGLRKNAEKWDRVEKHGSISDTIRTRAETVAREICIYFALTDRYVARKSNRPNHLEMDAKEKRSPVRSRERVLKDERSSSSLVIPGVVEYAWSKISGERNHLSQCPPLDVALRHSINYRVMRGFRERLIHRYSGARGARQRKG